MSKNETNDDDTSRPGSDEMEAREGLELLLGGISFESDAIKQAFQNSDSGTTSSTVSNDNEEDQQQQQERSAPPDPCPPSNKNLNTASCTFPLQHCANKDDDDDDDDDEDDNDECMLFSLAFKSSPGFLCTPCGRVERPYVRVVNMDDRRTSSTTRRQQQVGEGDEQQQQQQQNLGNGMIATRFIPKGEIIYTERILFFFFVVSRIIIASIRRRQE
jgi:hypothetical protein